MYVMNRRGALISLVADLERQCLSLWRDEVAPGESVVDALALHAREVNTGITRKLGGNILVTVTVLGRREQDSDTWWFKLQRRGNAAYEVVHQD